MKKMVFLLSVMTITLLGYCQGANKDGLLTYSILKDKVSDTQIKTQVELRILITDTNITDTNITEQRIRELLTYLYAISINRTGFKYSSNPTNVFIYAYTSKEKFESGFQWIGMIAKGYSESNPVISISDIQIKSLALKPVNRLGLSEKARVEIPNAKLKEYKIEFSEINQVDKKIKLKLKTNFPDGTVLNLWIHRTYYRKEKSEVYSGDLFSNDFIVKNGEIGPIENIIDDTKWYTEYMDLVKTLPNDMPPISKISDKITIDVMYSPLRSQPANVTAILGSHGEFVTGKGSEYFGTGSAGRFTTLSVSKELFFPMEGRVEKKSKYVSYLSLKKNETYAISKETPLAPEFQPSDPLAALSRMKYLPTGSRIRVLSIKDIDGFPWYEVLVMNKNGQSIGEGWINSIALNGQEIVIIK